MLFPLCEVFHVRPDRARPRRRRRLLGILSVTLLSLLLFSAACAERSSPSDYASVLRRLVADGKLNDLRWPVFSDCKMSVAKFYQRESYVPVWTHSGVLSYNAEAIIKVLEHADSKALNSEDYDASRWPSRLRRLHDRAPLTPDDIARFDLALTISVMRYISDLRFGRLNPGLFDSRREVEPGHDPDISGLVRELACARDIEPILSGLEPPFECYRRTLKAFEMYRAMAHDDDGKLLVVTRKIIEPGSSYAGATRLAGLLRRLGDFPPGAAASIASDKYEGALVDAVKHFQRRHGLDPDGRIGKATRKQLNTPLKKRVLELQLSLERWRWLPWGLSAPPIVVNIPEFRLRCLNSSYETVMSMKVVVGREYGHQTPLFAGNLKYVIFRPFWNVPLSIQRSELVPQVEGDRSYLTKNGYEIITPQGRVIGGGRVDDRTLFALRSGNLMLRQVPGPQNWLGLVKFVVPNEHNVYLHATPATDLFSASRRDLSHGCIRVERPELLAAWVLKDRSGWAPERIAEAMNGNTTVQVTLDRPIPVWIVYMTAIVLRSGETHFFDDIYGFHVSNHDPVTAFAARSNSSRSG